MWLWWDPGGGASVTAADICSSAGLNVPMLPVEIRRGLSAIFGAETGAIFRNPVDLNIASKGMDMVTASIKLILNCDLFHFLMIHGSFDLPSLSDKKSLLIPYIESLLSLKDKINKPLVVVIHSNVTDEAR